jgi:hypothetical protein
MKHLIGIGLVLSAALVLRFWYHADGGFTFYSNYSPTRFVPFNVLASWVLLVVACTWSVWVGTAFIIHRLR